MQIVNNSYQTVVSMGQMSDSVCLHDERASICDHDDDLIRLNSNNNSCAVGTEGLRCGAVVSLSHSSVYLNGQNGEAPRNKVLPSHKAQHSSLKRRWPANKPRGRRPQRQSQSNHVTNPRDNSGMQLSLETCPDKYRKSSFLPADAEKSTVPSELMHTRAFYVSKANLQNPERMDQRGTSKISGPYQTFAVGSREQRATFDQSKGFDSWPADAPLQSDNCYLDFYKTLERLSRYHSVSEIPETLKQNMIQTLYKHLVDRDFSDHYECILSRFMDIYKTPSEQKPTGVHNERLIGQDMKQNVKGLRIYPSQQASESIAYPFEYDAKPETSLDNPVESNDVFTSDQVFQEVYGPSFRRTTNYWQARPPVLPSYLFKYKTLEDGAVQVIGTGTFGEVVAATMNIKGHIQDIILKEPYSDMVTKDQVFDEAKITMYLEPTGYVPICYGLTLHGAGNHSIVLELFGLGTTLKEVVVQRHLSRLQWLCIACQLSEGLSKIHDMDILVNDIKADNVLVDVSGAYPLIKFCDMGCSSYKSGIAFDDANMDCFHHLAPEVRAGGQTSKANDVYGLGRLLDRIIQISLISGIVPISEKCLCQRKLDRITAKTALELLMALLQEEKDITFHSTSCDADHSSSDLSLEGYDPDTGVSSDSSPSSDALVLKKNRAGFCTEMYHMLSKDYQQARDDVYEKMCSSSNLDKLCLGMFVLLSVVLLFCRST